MISVLSGGRGRGGRGVCNCVLGGGVGGWVRTI